MHRDDDPGRRRQPAYTASETQETATTAFTLNCHAVCDIRCGRIILKWISKKKKLIWRSSEWFHGVATLKLSSAGHIRHFLLPSVVTESSHGTICLAVRSGGITSTKHEAIYNRKWKKGEKVLYTSHATLWYRRSRGRWHCDVIDWGVIEDCSGEWWVYVYQDYPLKQHNSRLDMICPIRTNVWRCCTNRPFCTL